jgi:hypothetical protein
MSEDKVLATAAGSRVAQGASADADPISVQQLGGAEPPVPPQIMPERTSFEATLQRLLNEAPYERPVDATPLLSLVPRPLRKLLKRENVLETFVRITPKLRNLNNAALYQEAHYALLLYQTDTIAAANLASNIEFQATEQAAITMVLNGAVRFLIFYGLAWWLLSKTGIYESMLARTDFLTVGIAGVVGAMISLAMRRDEFSETVGKSATYFKYTGFLLPLVGTMVGCVIYAALLSNIISVTFGEFKPGQLKLGQEFPVQYLAGCGVIGFFSGFSERLASGLMGRVTVG